jgi:hypothetical protein
MEQYRCLAILRSKVLTMSDKMLSLMWTRSTPLSWDTVDSDNPVVSWHRVLDRPVSRQTFGRWCMEEHRLCMGPYLRAHTS